MNIQLPVFFQIFSFLIGMLLIYIFVRAVSELWNHDDLYQSTKILWMIFIVLAPFIGILCYIKFGNRSDFEVEEEDDEEEESLHQIVQ